MDLIDAAQSGSITIVLAALVTLLLGGIVFLFKLLVDELRGRANRAEALVDGMKGTYDTLSAATDKAADVAQAALEELRRSTK